MTENAERLRPFLNCLRPVLELWRDTGIPFDMLFAAARLAPSIDDARDYALGNQRDKARFRKVAA